MATFKIKIKKKCIDPILNGILQNGDTIEVKWNTTYVTPGAVISLQYSLDNGANWVDDPASISTGNDTVFNPTFAGYSAINGIRFRLKSSAIGCVTYSNVIVRETRRDSIIDVINVVTISGLTTYDLRVLNDYFVGFAITRGRKVNNCDNGHVAFSPFGNDIILPSSTPALVVEEDTKPIILPVGIYPCFIDLTGIYFNDPTSIGTDEIMRIDGGISYNIDISYAPSTATATGFLETPAP